MSITLQHQIRSLSDLPKRVSTIISWIPGAEEWFNNALTNNAPDYVFETEDSLLESLITGIHSSELLYLNKCKIWVSPKFLSQATDSQFSLIQQIQNNSAAEKFEKELQKSHQDKATSQQIEAHICQLLSEEKIYSTEQLHQVDTFLEQLNIRSHGLFKNMSLNDQVNLLPLAQGLTKDQSDHKLAERSAGFSLHNSTTLPHFIAIYQLAYYIFQYQLKTTPPDKVFNNDNFKATETIISQLLKLGIELLSCPQITPPMTINDVAGVIQQWGTKQLPIGFNDVAAAILCLGSHFNIDSLTDPRNYSKELKAFEKTLTEFQANCTLMGRQLSQDGLTWLLTFQYQNYQAHYDLSENGCISLHSFSKNK